MCGRLVGVKSKAELDDRLRQFQDPAYWAEVQRVLKSLKWTANYNTTPTQQSAIIRQIQSKDGEAFRDIEFAAWGFTTYDGKPGFNATVEKAPTTSLYSKALRERRVLIPTQGWYEWKGPKGKGVPQFIHQETVDGELPVFFFAGMWRSYKDETDQFTILTDEARGHMTEVHHRQPIIIPGALAKDWLDTNVEDYPSILELLSEASHSTPEGIVWHEVGREVGSNKATGSQLIEPFDSDSTRLF